MKHWYESRTIWLGIATVALAGLSAAVDGASWMDGVFAAVGALAVLLRTQTYTHII